MRDLHVAHVVCGDGFAGVERYVATLATGLAGHGCAVTVIGGNADAMRAAFATTTVEYRPGSTMAQAYRALRHTRGVDVINAHMTQAELIAVVAGAAGRTPVVSTRHFGRVRGSRPSARAVGRWMERRLAAQIAISDFVAASSGSVGEVIHSGVDSIDAVVPGVDREPVVLVAQRLEAEKETSTALRAWSSSTARMNGWRMWVAGSGTEEVNLRNEARDLGIGDTVDFLGHRPDLPDLLQRASVFLATTPIEGFGLSVVEAMAAGLPVIASSGGGHGETAGGIAGAMMFRIGDASQAATMLDALVADPALRDRYGAALRERQRTCFTIERQVAETLAVYERVSR